MLQPEPYPDRHPHRARKRRYLHTSHGFNTYLIDILSVAALVIGIWLSTRSGDWQWFSRSGSILVALGVLLTSSQILENSRRLRVRRLHHASNFKHDFAGDFDRHRLEYASLHEEDAWHSGLHGLYLLVVGTLIWGFGDLIGWML